MIKKWLKKIQERRNKEIAQAVRDNLTSGSGWEKFLPPVAMDGMIYMVTENGSVYRLERDRATQMEIITKIVHK